jgi:putative transposase
MLIKADTNVPETKEIFKSILERPETLFEMMAFDMKEIAERTLSAMLKQELTLFLGREKYQRAGEGQENRRNGYYKKGYTVKNLGELSLQIPRDREGDFSSKIIQKYDRYDKRIEKDICLMFLSGLSTRGIELISQSLIGRRISASEVSKINGELLTGLEAWRTRDLSAYRIKYMYIDGVNFHCRVKNSVEVTPMLVVVGVTEENKRTFLAIQQGDKESATTWRQIFKDMKRRGLNPESVQLGVMDGLSGLMTVFRDEFSNAKVQRCQVHVARNVLTKVPHKIKLKVADSLRDIFYASTRAKAKENFEAFVVQYEPTIPSAVKCLSNVIEECLTYHSFPQEHWISLRTTNVIERVNKEFKRRTKPMEVLAGEKSAYRLLCFIALKMELSWKTAPFCRRNILPALGEFTQVN